MLRKEVGESDEVGGYILDRVAVAADHATGCAMLGEARLAAPCAVVTRSLLEGFFGTYWASLDDSKGRQLMEATKKELLRITRVNLTNGHATIRDRVTGEDRTRELLRHPAMAKAERLPRFDHMANEAGLKKIYDALYGLMSMLAHGAGTHLMASGGRDGFIYAQLHAATAVVRCEHLILVNRIRQSRTTRGDEIASIFKVTL